MIDEDTQQKRYYQLRRLWSVTGAALAWNQTPPFTKGLNSDCTFHRADYYEFENNEHGKMRIRVCTQAGCTAIVRERDGKAAYLAEIAVFDPQFFLSLRRHLDAAGEAGFGERAYPKYRVPNAPIYDLVSSWEQGGPSGQGKSKANATPKRRR